MLIPLTQLAYASLRDSGFRLRKPLMTQLLQLRQREVLEDALIVGLAAAATNTQEGSYRDNPGLSNHRTVSANDSYLLPGFVILVYHHLSSGKQGTDKAGVRAMKGVLSNLATLQRVYIGF